MKMLEICVYNIDFPLIKDKAMRRTFAMENNQMREQYWIEAKENYSILHLYKTDGLEFVSFAFPHEVVFSVEVIEVCEG